MDITFRSLLFQVFRTLEHPAELTRMSALNGILYRQRRHLAAVVVNSQGREVANLSSLLVSALGNYERALQEAVSAGVQIVYADTPVLNKPVSSLANGSAFKNVHELEVVMASGSLVQTPAPGDEEWSLVKAVFFSSTVLTTIGRILNC